MFSFEQLGFRKHKSTVDALITLIDNTLEGLNEGSDTMAIMCQNTLRHFIV